MIRLVKRSIKSLKDQKVKYYPAVSYSGTIDSDAICEQISAKSTFTHADVLSTMCALEDLIAQKLQNGCIVRLGLLGSFRTSLRATEGMATKEEVDAKKIKRVHMIFSPSSQLNKEIQAEAQYEMKDA